MSHRDRLLADLREQVAEAIPESWTDPIVETWTDRRGDAWLQVRWYTPTGGVRSHAERIAHLPAGPDAATFAFWFIRQAQTGALAA